MGVTEKSILVPGRVELSLEGEQGAPESGAPEEMEEQESASQPVPDNVDKERTPILWHSNAPWVGSGYGTQTGLFGPMIQRDLGYQVGFSAFFGLKGRRIGWVAPHTGTAHTVYPAGKDNHGNDVLTAHTAHYFGGRRGMVVFLSDVWVLRHQLAAQLPMLAWCPVDHDPVTPATATWFKLGKALPIAMSLFGKEQLERAGVPDVQYVPHGFNAEVFKPADRKEARRAMGIPEDAFVAGMVAANLGSPSRKSFAQAFQAFANFQRDLGRDADVYLYLHTMTEAANGENLAVMAESLGVRFIACDQYGYILGAPEQVVSATLNSFDVLLNPSRGEGFGVPLVEAQACGTPCITTNFSAMPEVAPVEAGNWTVDGQKEWTGFESWQMIPSVEELTARLHEAYSETEEERTKRRVDVWRHAQQYESQTVLDEHWRPTLKWCEQELAWRRKRPKRWPS